MSKNTDTKVGNFTKGSIDIIERTGTDFIKNFNRISSNQLSVVESEEQVGIDFISRAINSYESPNNVNIENIFKKLGYNEETIKEVMKENKTISEDEFQDKLYDYYISPF